MDLFEKRGVKKVALVFILLVISFIVGFFWEKGKSFAGFTQSQAIDLVGSSSWYKNLTENFDNNSKTLDIAGLTDGTLYLNLIGSTTVSGLLYKLEYSPDGTNFYGFNNGNATTTATATTSLVSVNKGVDFLWKLDGGGSVYGSSTIPVNLSGIAATHLKISFKTSSSTDNSSLWGRFVGKEKD